VVKQRHQGEMTLSLLPAGVLSALLSSRTILLSDGGMIIVM
jgi:hypothetical protein